MKKVSLPYDFFRNHFSQNPHLKATSPGRVNIIGEHTDYNGGWVLPAAIDKQAMVLIAKNGLDQHRFYAYDIQEAFEFGLAENPPTNGWEKYAFGVVRSLEKHRDIPQGMDVLITGNVPFGAGLSSSAAIECALALAINDLFELGLDKKTLAYICQKAEHDYVGVKCGIMDQFASLFGQENHAMLLDCQKVDHEYVPLELGEHVLLLCNTNVSHSLASSAYNDRRAACEKGVSILKQYYPNISQLRDVDEQQLNAQRDQLDADILTKCLYVVQENARVIQACQALKDGDLQQLGQLMYASHDGLSNMYDVSCKELDFLVGQARHFDAIIGSRMMGGGFGGCTINIIHKDEVNHFIEKVAPLYESEFGKEMTPIIAQIGNGAQSHHFPS